MDELPIGTFVSVCDDVGVIVAWPNEVEDRDQHVAVWFGETTSDGTPRCRTVPSEYCRKTDRRDYYH